MLLSNRSNLIAAILRSDFEETERLIPLVRDVNFTVELQNPLRRVSPLHVACESQNPEKFVQLLLDKGAKGTIADINTGITPLHNAVEKHQHGIAELMVEKNPRLLTACDRYGKTPLHYAAKSNNLHYLNFCLGFKLNQKPKCDVNVIDSQGVTPLHLAASYGNQAAAQTLIKWGANVHAGDKANETPDSYAELEFSELSQYLKSKMIPTLFLFAAHQLRSQEEQWNSLPENISVRAENEINEHKKNLEIAEKKEIAFQKELANTRAKFSNLKI